MTTPSTPEVLPINVPPQTPPAVPVVANGMNEYIREPVAEIQEESRSLLAKLRAEVENLIVPQNKPNPIAPPATPVDITNETGIVSNRVIT